MLELLRVYDDEVRGSFLATLPADWVGERDGPLARCTAPREGFATLVADASGLTAAELAALVERTVAFYRERELAFEWKTYDHDRADLIPLLAAAGGRPEPHEALVLGEAAALTAEVELTDLTVRRVSDRVDLEHIAELETVVWGQDESWRVDELEQRAQRGEIFIFVVEDGDLAVTAGWLEPLPGTHIAGLWGGSTRPGYRGRGAYRALVAARARLALELGYPIVQVDASDDSRPILARLGLRVVGGTTPYKFEFVASADGR